MKKVDCFARDEDDIEMERMFLDVSSPLYGYYVQMEPLKRFTPTREIYDNYLFWCRDKGIKPKALSTFSSQFALVSRSSYKRMILIKMRMENIFEDMNRYKITMFKLTRLPGSDFDMY